MPKKDFIIQIMALMSALCSALVLLLVTHLRLINGFGYSPWSEIPSAIENSVFILLFFFGNYLVSVFLKRFAQRWMVFWVLISAAGAASVSYAGKVRNYNGIRVDVFIQDLIFEYSSAGYVILFLLAVAGMIHMVVSAKLKKAAPGIDDRVNLYIYPGVGLFLAIATFLFSRILMWNTDWAHERPNLYLLGIAFGVIVAPSVLYVNGIFCWVMNALRGETQNEERYFYLPRATTVSAILFALMVVLLWV